MPAHPIADIGVTDPATCETCRQQDCTWLRGRRESATRHSNRVAVDGLPTQGAPA